ncbi:hypothetical protein AN928_08335 [Pseudomonas aeruginosa]|nr:hypothetical protein AN928_08335 [Pseudomonas aeruginosa]
MRFTIPHTFHIHSTQVKLLYEVVTKQYRNRATASLWEVLQVFRKRPQSMQFLKFFPKSTGNTAIVH